ncbi:SpaA isopeptide-forming pilin-related protein [Enterococcus faecalis]|uniref:SpaA isopeptide-forming pilin-related protein n=1 Tax=Enterococcus faecalis TaxID=1351 RepID=UPI0025AF524C|nr:SpaA isopeptide-forming pilin-related protein [Enterococcus faecalis]MDN3201522.1 SpaA isopeptide-forming pilin-related protein [Enterococcus faecalis]
MKDRLSKVKSKFLVLLSMLTIIGANVVPSTIAMAESLDNTEQVAYSNEKEEKKISEESTESSSKVNASTTTESTQSTQKELDKTIRESMNSNDIPIDSTTNSSEATATEATSTTEVTEETQEKVERTGEELANRANPRNVQGLTDNEIISLAKYLYGDYAKKDSSFGMSVRNDKGESIEIPFDRQTRFARSIGAVGNPVYARYDVSRGAWTAWGEFYQPLYIDDKLAYCVEPGVIFTPGAGFTQQASFNGITAAQCEAINTVMNFGAKKGDSGEYIFATNMYIWEKLGWSVSTSLPGYANYKQQIENNIAKFRIKPSFHQKTYNVKVGETLKITDKNGVLNNFSIKNNLNARVEKKGNVLEITPNANSKNGDLDLFRNTFYTDSQFFWVKPGSQAVTTGGSSDPTVAFVKINVIKNGNVKIKKVDVDTGKAISGAKFKLSYGGRNVEVVTNANGEADLKDIPHGTKVTITEIQAANGYVLNKTPQTVTIKANQTVTATFKNKKQAGRLDLIKEDKETGNQPQGSAKLEGAVYGLFETNGQKVKEVVLKKAGDKVTGSFENIQIMHEYYVQEIKAPEGYNIDSTKYPVNIAYAGQDKTVAVKTMTLKDQVIKGGVEIVKIGNKPLINQVIDKVTGKSDNVKPKLEGAEFTITSKTTGKPVKVMTTDKDGKASTGKTLPYDSYVMEETKTPKGYLPIEPIEFTISEEDQKFFWVLEDKIIEARLHLVKVDAETGKNIPLRDTTFKIWDRWANDGKGDYVSMRVPNSLEISDEFKTNEKGEFVTSDSLPFGKDRYEIRELRAPEGYLLATEPAVFSVTEADAGGVITIKFENMPQKGQVKIHKTGEKGISTVEKECEYGKYAEIQYDQVDLAGVKFKIRAREDITTPDGTVRLAKGEYVQKDGKDFELVTNDLGMTESEPNLYLGKYEAVEIEAPNGFVLLKDPIPFEIKYEGQLVEFASTTVKVENQLQEINVYGYKKQEVVTGWEEGKPVIELENAKNGQVFGLFVGEGGIQIGFDILPHDTALAFAKVKDGKLAFEGLTLPNVESNFYLKEIDAGNDHVLDETKYGFKYVPSTNEKEHTIHVFADGYAENKEILTKMARKEIENKLAYTDVELLKTDNLGNKPLEGVEFQLIRVDGKKETVVNTYKTDKDGKITVKKLPTGNYRFKETKPLSWYYPNADDLSFEVTPETNGQFISLKAVNKRKPMEITTLLAIVDGKKEANPTIDNTLRDEVKIKGSEVGHTYTIVTPYVDPETKKVITIVESTYTAKAENETIHVDIPIAKNTMKDGQKGVATHYIYYDKEKTKLVGKEDNLANKDQTVTFKTPKALPKTGETANVAYVALGLFLFVCASFVLVRRKVKE